jgi:hypothetical protein
VNHATDNDYLSMDCAIFCALFVAYVNFQLFTVSLLLWLCVFKCNYNVLHFCMLCVSKFFCVVRVIIITTSLLRCNNCIIVAILAILIL